MKYKSLKRVLVVWLLIIFPLYFFVPLAWSQGKNEKGKENLNLEKIDTKKLDYVPGEIIVKYKEDKINLKIDKGLSNLEIVKSKFSLSGKEQLKKINIEILKTKNSVENTIRELKKDENIEYAEPNYIRKLATINTSDTYKDYLWGLDNTGQRVNGTTGTVDKDIDAPAGWGLSEGEGVIVAVIDSGVAYNHPDLINNMWNGSNCKDENGSYLGGCIHGYDFENNDNNPLPDSSSHGTHVAGIIAAEKNNSKGVIGVAPKVKIMALKSGLTVSQNLKAVNFAIQNGAKIINASYGGNYYSSTEYDSINSFRSAGGIFVAAAGNDSVNNDGGVHNYPSDYDLDNIISVAATDQNDNLASFSNYGNSSVDIGAPGVNIYSTEGFVFFNENFESVSVPSLGNYFTQSGNNSWGTKISRDGTNKAMFSDYQYWGDYRNNITSELTSSSINLSSVPNAYLNFDLYCDSENGYDGLILYFWNGSSWVTIDSWSGTGYLSPEYSLSSYYNSSFKFKFKWMTDGSNLSTSEHPSSDYDGCYVDNIKLIDSSSYSDSYQYLDGTSMATPFVSGSVAVFMSKYPTLSITDIKNVLVNTGADPIPSLVGKTVYGKRLNLYRALLSSEAYTPGSVYRFWSNNNLHHFYTASKSERDKVASVYYDQVWKYEHVAYRAFTESGEDKIPLYRFWSDNYQGHFYTASESEKNNVINNNPNWRYEQIAYYVYDSGYTGSSTLVYRFWSDNYRGHFYTSSESEMNNVKNNNPNWRYEGVVFKVAVN